MYVFFIYNNFFLLACFVNSSPEVTFGIALVLTWYLRLILIDIVCRKDEYYQNTVWLGNLKVRDNSENLAYMEG
jgi:hypothetical protein